MTEALILIGKFWLAFALVYGVIAVALVLLRLPIRIWRRRRIP